MDVESREYRTPKGRRVRLWVRPRTNDAMMSESSLNEDEYRLADVALGDAAAIDVGSHIGQVAIGLALDNPAARIFALEPVPENVELLRRNLVENDLVDRVTVLAGATATKSRSQVEIAYDFSGGEIASMHRYVGNQPMPDGTGSTTISVPGYTLPDLMALAGGPVALIVTDCEGGEYALLRPGTALRHVAEVRGEYHDGFARLVAQLDKTHDVERLAGGDGFGSFVARLRR